MIQAIVFDMDGLIFDSERIVQRSWDRAGEEMGISAMGSHIYNTIGFNRKRRNQYFYDTIGADFPVEEFAELASSAFRKIADVEGVPLKQGAKELIKFASEQGYKLAVATSSRRVYSESLLKEGGVYSYFNGFVYGDMVQNAKPDPEIYLRACACIGADPKYSMALEDSPAGIRAAAAAGMIPVMVPDLVEPDAEIQKLFYRKCKSLLEVKDVLLEVDLS